MFGIKDSALVINTSALYLLITGRNNQIFIVDVFIRNTTDLFSECAGY